MGTVCAVPFLLENVAMSRRIGPLNGHADEIKEMRLNGVSVKEISEHFDLNYGTVKSWLYCNRITIQEYRNSESTVARRVREATNNLCEYIDGYINKESPIKVRCLQCGAIIERTYHNITTHGFYCPVCVRQERANKAKQKEIEKAEKEKRKAERLRELERKREQRLIPHSCPVCGALTIRPKYCSDACAHKAYNHSHDTYRRGIIAAAMVDKDITVEGLFQRDKGICQICGKPCDYNDYIYKGDAFVAGNNYPSVDHIIPLSKGGEHSWGNVRLAHRHCNILEYKKQLTISPSGQLSWITL